ncbi:class V lanthionine synthetase subunit LxmK [Streptomyces sp. NPDC006385]|uniref:class V lanthionine synthetase subunit LxmK n=1 Tax=Streptomyces sp. NPDC006385 TaxID=3156761 RepID=UPI0033A234C1
MATPNRAPNRAVTYQPKDLAEAPEVDAFLARLGLGPFDRTTITSNAGRNDNWVGTTTEGTAVFVKRLRYKDAADGISRTQAIYAAADGRLDFPRLLGADQDNGLLVFEAVPEARSGAQLASDDAFDDDVCDRAATVLAALHSLEADGIDAGEHPFPPVENFEALSLAQYLNVTHGQLEIWRLLHGDEQIARALRDLRATEVPDLKARCPIHGDLRLDQFLLSGGRLYLTDFEESRIGDPARDIGAFAGEWLFQAIHVTPSTLAGASQLGHIATHEEIVATGSAELERRRPKVRRFLRTYLEAAPTAITSDEQLLVRAASYAGWHMIDRMLAGGMGTSRLSPVSKAAAGIGRTVLLSPADFTSSLGLEA